MKQEITRAHKWALDNVTLHNEVLRNMAEEIKKPPPVRNDNYTTCVQNSFAIIDDVYEIGRCLRLWPVSGGCRLGPKK